MKVYVVNVFYNEVEQPQVNRIFKVNKDGTQEEVIKETVIYERCGTVVLACESATDIMPLLQARISDQVKSFELVSETNLTAPTAQTQGIDGEPELTGEVIFQIGI